MNISVNPGCFIYFLIDCIYIKLQDLAGYACMRVQQNFSCPKEKWRRHWNIRLSETKEVCGEAKNIVSLEAD